MTKFMKDAISNASKTLRKAVKDGNGLPSTLAIKDSNGKVHKLDKAHYMGLFESRNVFALKHGRVPNYVTLNTTANNPLVLDYQDNSHTCCPTSLSMCIGFLFDYHSEKECAKVLGTGDYGTSPDQLMNNAPKLGVTVTPIGRNWDAVKKELNKGRPVIAHIQTKPATCLGYKGDYGHYIVIYGAYKKNKILKKYKIADPTKGLKICRASILDKATNGRDIKYYSVKPK